MKSLLDMLAKPRSFLPWRFRVAVDQLMPEAFKLIASHATGLANTQMSRVKNFHDLQEGLFTDSAYTLSAKFVSGGTTFATAFAVSAAQMIGRRYH